MHVTGATRVKKNARTTYKKFWLNSSLLIDLVIYLVLYVRPIHTVTNFVAADAQNYSPREADSRNSYVAFSGVWELGTS